MASTDRPSGRSPDRPMGLALGRRGFLRRAAGRHRVVTLSCGRLYVQYVDAVAAGRIRDFVCAIEREIRSATEIHLTEHEWLARDDFAATLNQILARRRSLSVR